MPTHRNPILSALTAVILLSFTLAARADSFSAVFVYGDSLSDNGNVHSAIGLPPPPYYNGRFSNGPVAVEQLAAQLVAPLFDFAWGGATTGVGNGGDEVRRPASVFYTCLECCRNWRSLPVPPALIPSSLFVVWGGANDFEVGGLVTTAIGDIDTIVASSRRKAQLTSWCRDPQPRPDP